MRTFALTVSLLALVGFAFADDDPEPPSGSLHKLQGTWNSVRRIAKGEEMAYTQISYTFEKNKVTYTAGKGKLTRTMTVKTDKKRPDALEMTQDNVKGGAPMRYFFKIEKGELYLSPVRAGVADPKPDFSGNNGPVLILTREKK